MVNSNKGRKLSEDHKRKIGLGNKGNKRPDVAAKIGPAHPLGRGNSVGYDALHSWVKRYKTKPLMCERCNSKKTFDLANKSGKYLRDINDFEWLCRKCHMIKDGRLTKFTPVYAKQFATGACSSKT